MLPLAADRTIRAVVFDLDGVLLDSAPCHRAAFEEVFQPFGLIHFDYPRYAGWRTADVVEDFLRGAALDPDPDLIREMSRNKSRIAREKLAAANPISPDCVSVLEELSRQYTLGLASSGSRQSVELFLNTNRCAGLFRSVLSGDDVERAKPAPEIYERTFEALHIAPADGVVVEDAAAGIVAAKSAGVGYVIGFAGTSPVEQLTAVGADLVIRTLGELRALLCAAYESVGLHGN